MKTLESYLGSRMRGYGSKSATLDYFKIKTVKDLKEVADEMKQAIEADPKATIHLNSTIYRADNGDFSWVAAALDHLDDFDDNDMVLIDTSYKVSGRFHPSLRIKGKNWNDKTKKWE